MPSSIFPARGRLQDICLFSEIYLLTRRQSCRTIMENAVQSLLQVPNLPAANVSRALLLRAKGRLAAGYRTSAQQGKCSSIAFRACVCHDDV